MIYCTSSWAQKNISYKPPRFRFLQLQTPSPRKIFEEPPYNSSSRISCADLETFWKLGSKKSQIEMVSLSGFHQPNLRHTHLGDLDVPSKYSRKHQRDYLRTLHFSGAGKMW